MSVADALKQLLVCPQCKGPLEFYDARAEIVCRACALVYPVRDDVPVMLVSEAKPLQDDLKR
jgi:uncharacterized protein YbaR (Trm112 family)